MSDLKAAYDEYQQKYGKAPTATQLARIAGVKYIEASNFL